MIALLSEISIVLVIAISQVPSVSYEFRHRTQPLSDTPFRLYTYTRNSKTSCLMLTQILNDCSTIGDVYFLCLRWMRDTNGEVRLHCSHFLTRLFCVYLDITLENLRSHMDIQHLERLLYILSETFFVLFRFAQEIQLESYNPRHALVVL